MPFDTQDNQGLHGSTGNLRDQSNLLGKNDGFGNASERGPSRNDGLNTYDQSLQDSRHSKDETSFGSHKGLGVGNILGGGGHKTCDGQGKDYQQTGDHHTGVLQTAIHQAGLHHNDTQHDSLQHAGLHHSDAQRDGLRHTDAQQAGLHHADGQHTGVHHTDAHHAGVHQTDSQHAGSHQIGVPHLGASNAGVGHGDNIGGQHTSSTHANDHHLGSKDSSVVHGSGVGIPSGGKAAKPSIAEKIKGVFEDAKGAVTGHPTNHGATNHGSNLNQGDKTTGTGY